MELELETNLSRKPAQELNDTTALTVEQQRALDGHKIKTRIENELYLRKHPEISVILSSFVSDVLLKKPEKVREHAASFFADQSLPDLVKAKLEAKKEAKKHSALSNHNS